MERASGEPLIRVAETTEDLAAARAIRHQVFVEEQGIPAELDQDGLDDCATHVLALADAAAVGTGRLVVGSAQSGTLARIAVVPAWRGRRLGEQIVTALEQQALRRHLQRIQLCPHAYLEGFYRRLGYRVTDGKHQVGRHELITMEKRIHC